MAEPGSRAWIEAGAARLTGRRVAHVEAAGGAGRGSARVRLADGTTLLATRRATEARTAAEAGVMQVLSRAGAPVPAVVAHGDGLLLLEDPGDRSVAAAMAEGDAAAAAWGAAAVEGLERCRAAFGSRRHILARLPTLGSRAGWTDALAAEAAVLSVRLDIAPPEADLGALAEALAVPPKRFTRWNAGPDRAAAMPDGTVRWLDWTACGRRGGVEDVAALIASERWTLGAGATLVAVGAGGGPVEGARALLLRRMAVALAVRRLEAARARREAGGVATRANGDGDADPDRDGVAALCARMAALAEACDLVAPFGPWFMRARAALAAMP